MIQFASESSHNQIEPIPSGLGIDRILGIGGVPRKRLGEIFGDSGLGKSTLCLQLVAAAQKEGLRCLWADVEWSWSNLYAEQLGVDTKKLGLLQIESAEEMLDAIAEAISEGKWDLVILDSIGGLLPRAEIEKGAEGKVIGGQAGLVARFCRKVVPQLMLKDVALVCINHSFVDIMSGAIKTSGGAKLAYHKSWSIRLKKAQKNLMQGEKKIGEVILAEVRKNKVAGTVGEACELSMIYGSGFMKGADTMQDALDQKIIEKRGNSFYLDEEKLCVGLPKLRELFKEEVFADKIKARL